MDWQQNPAKIQRVVMQIFVDDFQPKDFNKSYTVSFDGERIPYVENLINALQQSGPIGKLLTVDILPEYLSFFADHQLDLYIDDNYTKEGDGYAIDFVRILINPKIKGTATVSGKVLDNTTQQPIANAQVTSSSGSLVNTDANGNFTLQNVTAGLALINASKEEYESATLKMDVEQNAQKNNIIIKLSQSDMHITSKLDKTGHIDLYGIQFDVSSDKIKSESEATLNSLLQYIQQHTTQTIIIAGHTDSDGSKEDNKKLSLNRANAVKKWLVDKGCKAENIITQGYGATKPVASNTTAEGKRLNRRVEISIKQ